jgi:hypothetical protein
MLDKLMGGDDNVKVCGVIYSVFYFFFSQLVITDLHGGNVMSTEQRKLLQKTVGQKLGRDLSKLAKHMGGKGKGGCCCF